jgi:hypothetical protein
MKIHCGRLILPLFAMLGLAVAAFAADPPAGNVGFRSGKPTIVGLGSEFTSMNG